MTTSTMAMTIAQPIMPISAITRQASLIVPPSTIGLSLSMMNEVGDQSQLLIMPTSFIHQ